VIIGMKRAVRRDLRKFNVLDAAAMSELTRTHDLIVRWASNVALAADPPMPESRRNRAADNWQVLLAIADATGYGREARKAAEELSGQDRAYEDPIVILLVDIRDIFNRLGVDRILSVALIKALHALEDSPWNEWRGLRGDRPPRPLTQNELSALLRNFGIKPRSIRIPGEGTKGYMRAWFERTWAAYLVAETGTPAQSNNIRRLRDA
jgi:hypothetical protein